MKRGILVAGLLLALACAPACASGPPEEQRRPLPFQIALAPLSPDDVRVDDGRGGRGDATKMRIDVDLPWLASFTHDVARVLERRSFARVEILDVPRGGPLGDARPLSPLERDAAHVRAALSRGADLLVRLEIALQPEIREEKNGAFWVNLPLFVLGGPFGWWIPDRTYFVTGEVTARFYDPRTLPSTLGVPLRETKAEIASVTRRTERLNLDFVDRAQGDVGDYLLSMICPAGFLAGESDELESHLGEAIVVQLADGLARSVLDQTSSLERGAAPFFLEVGGSTLARDASGALVLRGSVVLEPTRDVEGLGRLRIRAGAAPPLVRTFDSGPPPEVDGPYLRYRFEERLELVPAGAPVHLEIEAGERAPRLRSYTFRAPPD